MKIRLETPLRKSVDGPVPNSTLFVGKKSIVIDEQNLPAKLVRVLPPAYGHATPEQWRPFVNVATAMGLLK